jgi:CDGSH-type Zn-finger protein/uncharacterized Fe-S cluster protein YjdI
MGRTFDYDGEGIVVTWDRKLCIHVGECGRASGDLFVAKRKPWCQPDLVGIGDTVAVVERCPTGALTYAREDGEVETAPESNRCVVANHGPLYLTGDLDIDGGEDLPGTKFRAALCRCGASKNKPFCDNSHEPLKFQDRGAIGTTGPGLQSEGGTLTVKRIPNGPLHVQGNLTLVTAAGREAWRGTEAWLCRCGASKNKPFCDGSHREAGFEAE